MRLRSGIVTSRGTIGKNNSIKTQNIYQWIFVSRKTGRAQVEYEFEVKAKLGAEKISSPVSYSFTIAKPWYLRTSSLVIYFFSAILLLIIINILLYLS